MSDKDILVMAKALISDPEKWIKGADATSRRPREGEDAEDIAVDVYDPEAFCFCAGGAIMASAPNERAGEVALRLFADVNQIPYTHILNDRPGTTHADVMAAFDLAITAAS